MSEVKQRYCIMNWDTYTDWSSRGLFLADRTLDLVDTKVSIAYFVYCFMSWSSGLRNCMIRYVATSYGETCCLHDNQTSVTFPVNAALKFVCGPSSSVGIAPDYGMDGPVIESRWGRDFPPVQTGPRAHPASCTMDTGSFPGVKCGWGVLLTTRPLLAPRSWKSRALSLPPSGPQPGPVTGLLYLLKFV
jgi:hypothetical protein